jgi:hypothetical protein
MIIWGKISYDKIRLALAYIEEKKSTRCNDYFLLSLLHENTKILMLGTIPGNASLENLNIMVTQKTILENYIYF